MAKDDDSGIIQPQTGPDCSPGAFDQDRQQINQLMQAMEDLRRAMMDGTATTERLHQDSLAGRLPEQQVNQPASNAEDAIARTRDVENIRQAAKDQKDVIDRILEQVKDLHLAGTKFLDERVSKAATAMEHMSQQFSNRAAQSAQAAFGGNDPMSGMVINTFVHGLTDATSGLAKLGLGAEGLLASFAGLSAAAVGLVAIFGLFEAFNKYNESRDFDIRMARLSPMAFDSIRGSVPETLQAARTEMLMNLAPGRSDKDADRLFDAAAGLRLGPGTTFREVQNLGWMFGMLEDNGVDVGTSKKVAGGMIKGLGMSIGQAETGMMKLASTAKTNMLDIGDYMDKITEMTKRFRHLGVTVLDVDKVFTGFADGRMANGEKLGYEGAMQATELQMQMRQRLTMGQAAYVAMTTGANLNVGSSLGFHGGGRLGDLANKGPAGAMLAAAYMRGGNVPGAYQATSDFYGNMVDQIMAGGQFSGLSANEQHDMRYMMTAQAMGMSDQYMSGDKGTIGLVQKVADRKPMTDEEFGRRMKEITPKPIDQLVKELGTDFKDMMGETHSILRRYNEFFRPWTELWEKIKDLLAAVFMPMMEKMLLWTSTIGKFLLSWSEHGLWGIGAAGNDAAAEYRKNAKFLEDLHKSGALQGYDKIRTDAGLAIKNSLSDAGSVIGDTVKGAKSRFDAFIGPLLNSEGGYVNDPNDHGGETRFGISKRSFPSLDIKNLTRDKAKEIYYNNYYKRSGADKIADPRLAELHFDAAVNHGIGGANRLMKRSGGTYEGYLAARYQYYDNIVARDPSQRKFYKGWMNRMANLKKTIASHHNIDDIVAKNSQKKMATVPKKELLGGSGASMRPFHANESIGVVRNKIYDKPLKVVIEHHSEIAVSSPSGKKQVARKVSSHTVNSGTSKG